MRKIVIILCLILCILSMIACTKTEKPDTNESSADKGISEYSEEKETKEEKENSVGDTGIIERGYVINHPLLCETPLFMFSIGDIIKNEQVTLEEDVSEKTSSGYLHYYIEDGITYVTGEPSVGMKEEYKTLQGVILTSDKYELKCGLKPGTPEKDIQEINPGFEKVSIEDLSGLQYPYMAAISSELDFDSAYWVKEQIPYEERKLYMNREFDDMGIILFVKDGKVTAVSVDYCQGLFYQFSITDVFMENHPVLKDRLWKWTSWEEIQRLCPENYEEKISEEGANGWIIYEIGEGIMYALPQYIEGKKEDQIAAVMLTSDKYKLRCGLQVGMEEKQLEEVGMPLSRYPKEIINAPEGGISLLKGMEDVGIPEYDSIYCFDNGVMNEQEMNGLLAEINLSDKGFATGGIRLIVFMYNQKISGILCY